MKKYRSVLILLGVIAALVSVSFWDDWKTKKAELLLTINKHLADSQSLSGNIKWDCRACAT